MPLHIDPFLLFVASLAYFVGGLLKGTMGFGLPILAIPIITIFSSLPIALTIAVLPVVATNLWQIWKFWEHRQFPFLYWFLVPGIVGLFSGAYLLKLIEDAYLEIFLGCLVLFYLIVRERKGGGTLSKEKRDKLAPMVGYFAGMSHGAIGLSGLVGTPFFHACRFGRPAFIFCNGLMFTVFPMLHLPALATVGLFQPSVIWIGLIAILPSFMGLKLGEKYGERIDAATFSKLVKGLLIITACLTIWNGLSELS